MDQKISNSDKWGSGEDSRSPGTGDNSEPRTGAEPHQKTLVDAVILLSLEVIQLLADRAARTGLCLISDGAVQPAVQVIRVLQAPVCRVRTVVILTDMEK